MGKGTVMSLNLNVCNLKWSHYTSDILSEMKMLQCSLIRNEDEEIVNEFKWESLVRLSLEYFKK